GKAAACLSNRHAPTSRSYSVASATPRIRFTSAPGAEYQPPPAAAASGTRRASRLLQLGRALGRGNVLPPSEARLTMAERLRSGNGARRPFDPPPPGAPMPIRATCPGCSAAYNLPDGHAGKTV